VAPIASDLTSSGDGDVPAIVALMNAAYRGADSHAGWTSEAGYMLGDRTNERLLRAKLATKPEACFLLYREERGADLTGCVWLEPLGNGLWYLGSLAIDPSRQGDGLGSWLLSAAEAWAGERGGARIRMTVVNVRDSLIAWYERRGYRLTGQTRPFPYEDHRFGVPQRDDLCFVFLEKALGLGGA